MTRRFERVLAGADDVRYPADIERIQQEIPELSHLTPGQVEQVYEAFSDSWAAGLADFGRRYPSVLSLMGSS